MSLSQEEARIVELIGEGYNRYDIADLMDLSPPVVRKLVRNLCKTFKCTQWELPQVVSTRASQFPRRRT